MIRRCCWASNEATTDASVLFCMSNQGEICSSRRSKVTEFSTSIAHSVCIHVVPHFGGVLITMSPSRNRNPAHRALSYTGFL